MNPCSLAAPCTLAFAVSGAANADQVLLASGDHTVGATLDVNASVAIEGPSGAARARLFYTGPVTTRGVSINASGAALRHIDLQGTTNGGNYLSLSATRA